MALNPLNSCSLEQLALKGLTSLQLTGCLMNASTFKSRVGDDGIVQYKRVYCSLDTLYTLYITHYF